MSSLLVHAALGALMIGVFFYVNAPLYRSDWAGSRVTFFEGLYYVLVTNAVLFPRWTMIDRPRRGLRRTWIYFTMSLFTSFGFAMGLYLAEQERQVRRLEP